MADDEFGAVLWTTDGPPFSAAIVRRPGGRGAEVIVDDDGDLEYVEEDVMVTETCVVEVPLTTTDPDDAEDEARDALDDWFIGAFSSAAEGARADATPKTPGRWDVEYEDGPDE